MALDMAKITKALTARKAGAFHLSDLYGEDWADLWIGDKVKAGNEFQRRVSKGEFQHVEDTGKKNAAGRTYRKVGS